MHQSKSAEAETGKQIRKSTKKESKKRHKQRKLGHIADEFFEHAFPRRIQISRNTKAKSVVPVEAVNHAGPSHQILSANHSLSFRRRQNLRTVSHNEISRSPPNVQTDQAGPSSSSVDIGLQVSASASTPFFDLPALDSQSYRPPGVQAPGLDVQSFSLTPRTGQMATYFEPIASCQQPPYSWTTAMKSNPSKVDGIEMPSSTQMSNLPYSYYDTNHEDFARTSFQLYHSVPESLYDTAPGALAAYGPPEINYRGTILYSTPPDTAYEPAIASASFYCANPMSMSPGADLWGAEDLPCFE